jgi:hypothetical protein
VADEGFEEFFAPFGVEEKTAHEWRQRHITAAVMATVAIGRRV